MWSLHLLYFITEHLFNFVAHGFIAGGTKMDRHPVGSLADFSLQARRIRFSAQEEGALCRRDCPECRADGSYRSDQPHSTFL